MLYLSKEIDSPKLRTNNCNKIKMINIIPSMLKDNVMSKGIVA
jgi:hypothetical protein